MIQRKLILPHLFLHTFTPWLIYLLLSFAGLKLACTLAGLYHRNGFGGLVIEELFGCNVKTTEITISTWSVLQRRLKHSSQLGHRLFKRFLFSSVVRPHVLVAHLKDVGVRANAALCGTVFLINGLDRKDAPLHTDMITFHHDCKWIKTDFRPVLSPSRSPFVGYKNLLIDLSCHILVIKCSESSTSRPPGSWKCLLGPYLLKIDDYFQVTRTRSFPGLFFSS